MATRQDKVTIKIPRPLYNRINALIDSSGYDSATDFIVHVLRDIVASHGEAATELRAEEMERVKDHLRHLGYL
jgi:Arc/MetJ-type ribon-helix-helix transcriptional regulator